MDKFGGCAEDDPIDVSGLFGPIRLCVCYNVSKGRHETLLAPLASGRGVIRNKT